MSTLSIGKWRALQQCSTPRGALAILAIDHRQNLRALLRLDETGAANSALTVFKQQVVGGVAAAASAVLLDPEYGAAQCIASGVLAGRAGLLTAIEVNGYTGDSTARKAAILPGWSVAKAKRMGASGIKMLVHYHPEARSAGEVEALVREVAADCNAHDIPLLLEPLSYSPDPAHPKLPPDARRRVVIESARRLTVLGVDVLKAEFPVDIAAEPDERVWDEACAELSTASSAPWVLLSASADYDTYLRQAAVACRAGASGVAAGRAIWREAADLEGAGRESFLCGRAHARMARLSALCEALARPWTTFYTAPVVEPEWYQRY